MLYKLNDFAGNTYEGYKYYPGNMLDSTPYHIAKNSNTLIYKNTLINPHDPWTFSLPTNNFNVVGQFKTQQTPAFFNPLSVNAITWCCSCYDNNRWNYSSCNYMNCFPQKNADGMWKSHTYVDRNVIDTYYNINLYNVGQYQNYFNIYNANVGDNSTNTRSYNSMTIIEDKFKRNIFAYTKCNNIDCIQAYTGQTFVNHVKTRRILGVYNVYVYK